MSTDITFAGGTAHIASAGTNSANPGVKAFLATLALESQGLSVNESKSTGGAQNFGAILRDSGFGPGV